MPDLPVAISIANPDPSAAPTTFTEFVALLRTLITAVVTGTYVPYIQGSATPAVSDQDKIWHRTDGSGRPMGTYRYYSGTWRKQYTGKLGELAFYQGDPAVDFDGTGLGIVGGEWDGWALCNGNNGTGDLSDRFIVGGRMTDLALGYTPGQWRSTVSGSTLAVGGDKTITLTEDNTYRVPRAALAVGKWEADGNSVSAGGNLLGDGSSTTILAADAGNETPDQIPTLPPYIAAGIVRFVGYA